jgi:hypothetical protein
MTVYIVLRQAPNQSFVWGTFSTLQKAEDFIDNNPHMENFYISEQVVDEG